MKLYCSIFCVFGLLFSHVFGYEEKKVEGEPTIQGHVFAWPFLKKEKMQPRGGSSKGGNVTLMEGSKPAWKKLQVEGLTKKEKDRLAILAMAGSYRVSFDFVEIAGFSEDYSPPQPYFSWGTERVIVLDESEGFISLQHALVMYFKDKEGKETGPHVMKHWRQDWSFEDDDLHVYSGGETWTQKRVQEIKGCWSQAVYQVDDSPRYEVVGEWDHSNGVSQWKSRSLWRPLPRREFSARDDYQVLEGSHEITLTPNGWIHTQQNNKLKLSKGGNMFVGKEYGINRYEEITKPDLAAGDESLKKTDLYWAEVRNKWNEVYDSAERFQIRKKVDDKKLWQEHFQYAAKVEKEGWNADEGIKHARDTIESFLVR